jgi:sRNA-binding protein
MFLRTISPFYAPSRQSVIFPIHAFRFKDPVDLVNVDGIGDQSFAEIIAHAKAGGSESASETAKEKKGSKKKAPGKAKAGTKKKSDETPAEKSKEK